MFLTKKVFIQGWGCVALISAFTAFAPYAYAADSIPSLPSVKESANELYLTARNFAPYQDYLLAPMATWLKDGKFVMRAAKDTGFGWRYSTRWQAESAGNPALVRVTSTGGLSCTTAAHPTFGFPFGEAESIDKEAEPSKRAAKILWNLEYLTGVNADLLSSLELGWFGEKKLARKAEGIFYRQFFFDPAPRTEGAAEYLGNDDVTMKEYLSFYAPPVVFGFAAVSWRYRGSREDDVWIYSPVLGRSRKVYEANRADALLDGLLTLEDFFVWSARPESVSAEVVDEKTLFVPFLASDPVPLQTERSSTDPSSEVLEGVLTGLGPYKRMDGKSTSVVWNYESSKFLQLPPWLPSSAVFVPRKTWILELSPRDPFSLLGRQVLVVDKETMLPVYKVVYDRKGLYTRFVIGGWLLAVSEKDQIRLPFCGMTLAVDRNGSAATAATILYVRTFGGKTSPLATKVQQLLDIRAHEKRNEQAAAASHSSSKGSSISETVKSSSSSTSEAPPDD